MSGTALNVGDTLFDWLANRDARARGETYMADKDGKRLDRSCHDLARILGCRSGFISAWMTLDELKNAGMTCMPQSISARIREVREWLQANADGQIQGQQREGAPRGVSEYRFNPDWTAPKWIK
jgi:hypothetical protein